MATRGGENEPSMEDILASIRRIIADDQSDAPPTPGPAARDDRSDTERRAARETRWRSLDEIEQSADEEEPYELTDEPPPESGGRRWYDEPNESEPGPEPASEPGREVEPEAPAAASQGVADAGPDVLELREEDEVLELTEELIEDEQAPAEAEVPPVLPLGPELDEPGEGDSPPLPADEAPLELTPEMEVTGEAEAEAGNEAPPETPVEPEDATPMAGMSREGQRGSQPSPAVAHAFSRLRQTMASESDRRNEQRGEAAAAQPELQANLEQLLRPMIKEWLDENLPQAVERLVREEVSRVANDPEND